MEEGIRRRTQAAGLLFVVFFGGGETHVSEDVGVKGGSSTAVK
jgi:hypothetical protein